MKLKTRFSRNYFFQPGWYIISSFIESINFKFNMGFQYISVYSSLIKTEEMKDYSTQCSSNLWKNKKRLFFYEFNINFALIFRKWKMVLNNLTLGIQINFYLQYPIHSYISWFYVWTVFYIIRKFYKLKASVLQELSNTCHCYLTI